MNLNPKHIKWSVGLLTLLALFTAQPVFAHVSEQGFVLLLPTTLYMISGTAAVVISLIVISVMPALSVARLYNSISIGVPKFKYLETGASLIGTACLAGLIYLGFYGPRDPLENLLPLIIWTAWWQGFILLQAVVGDLWRWVNPWTGLVRLIRGRAVTEGWLKLPRSLGHLPGILIFVCFGLYALVDIAPDDPARLAVVVASYWVFTFIGMLVFGAQDWLARVECFTMISRGFAKVSAFQLDDGKLRIGVPGWQLVQMPTASFSFGVFAVMILALGSFDGLNETFWWLGNIGINPLEFPGRSQVIAPNALGLLGALIALPLIFAGCIYVGLRVAKSSVPFFQVFAMFALSLLPIAAGYHFSHYLTSFLVNVQYLVAALSDPLDNGADYLNLGVFYVTSGFLNTRQTVEIIWLSQAAAVVLGHISSVMISHALALQLLESHQKAIRVQLPLAMFMIVYTIFGLWLLASPRGI